MLNHSLSIEFLFNKCRFSNEAKTYVVNNNITNDTLWLRVDFKEYDILKNMTLHIILW